VAVYVDAVDLILNFFTGYVSAEGPFKVSPDGCRCIDDKMVGTTGSVVMDQSMIVKNYLKVQISAHRLPSLGPAQARLSCTAKGWFFIDVLSSFPLEAVLLIIIAITDR
jgi:hypothetical protein